MGKIVDVPGHGQVEFPDNMDDAAIVAAIKKNAAPAKIDASEGRLPFRPFGIDTGLEMPQGVSRFMAGAGKAFVDIGHGVGNVITDAAPGAAKYGFSTRADTDNNKKLDADLMNTGAGMAGNITGNVAAAIPVAFVPGANTVAGGAAIGALSSALQPVGTNDSRGQNMVVGGVAGAAVPAAIRAAKVLRAGLVDPFTSAGQTKIAAGVIKRAAADPVAVAEKLRSARGATPGFNPTAGQAADDAGVAALERTVRATDPAGFDAVDKSQRGALVDALRSIAKTPEDRAAAVAARDAAVKPMYTAAKSTVVEGDSAIEALLKRPSMTAAQQRAAAIAAERGDQFAISAGRPAQTIASNLLDAQGNPMQQTIAATPAKLGGTALHDLKMGLDDAIGSPGTGGMQGAERNAALGTKDEFSQWLEHKIPAYAQAKSAYADMSRPINQMDIGTELSNRFTPALADQGGLPFKSTAGAYANALRKGDDLARNVTGMGGASLDGIMEPAQMQLLQGVAKDSATKAAAESIGRGAGSDTVQKISMSNLAAEAGIPNWMANVARVPGGWAKRAGDVIYGSSDEQIRGQLSELLRNPQAAAQALSAAGMPPSKIAQYLRMGAQAQTLAVPASANALEQ